MVYISANGTSVPITLRPGYLDALEADQLMTELLTETEWSRVRTNIAGKTTEIPRLICWVGGAEYDFFGARIRTHPWTEPLVTVRNRIEADTGVQYNSVLLNLYMSGREHVDWHADNEAMLGKHPNIASLSLGSTRKFLMRRNDSGEIVEFSLSPGSLAIMYGEAQAEWQHSIPRADAEVGPRINLTFRYFNHRGL